MDEIRKGVDELKALAAAFDAELAKTAAELMRQDAELAALEQKMLAMRSCAWRRLGTCDLMH